MASREEMRAFPGRFCPRFAELMRMTGLGVGDICAGWWVSPRAVRRWRDGLCAPHPFAGKALLTWLEQRLAAEISKG